MWPLLLAAALDPQAPPAHTRQEAHWAYVAPRATPPPREGHPVDAFVDAALLAAGLAPAPRADRATLLRRASFDLIGLPPTPTELDEFLADAGADAWERVIDRLLASPHYGERQALPWLDLARYGDTNGFNFDSPRAMWKWRDLLIDLHNRDVGFDRFTLLQLAGDLLPGAGDEGRIASGFHRNTMLNDEGGVDGEEARWERLLDRATTTATVWLGTTLHCAQCHDHKYDPISQREFYGLVACFEPDAEATLELPTPAQAERRERARAELQRLEASSAGPPAIAAAKQALAAATVDSTLVLRHRAEVPATTMLRIRGAYDARGAEVPADVPAALGPPLDAGARDRLALARWLVRPDHPLVARVYVNRLWAELFGRPLVATPDDFGTMGAAPSHPELLDWLAVHFVQSGWSTKALLRLLTTSAAYQRAAVTTSAQRELDPDNRWLASGARFRLPAELIRDQQLAASGLLVPTLFGPSVFPLQADTSGAVAVNKADLRWRADPAPGRHRRGLYTFWRRTATFVQFAVFDAPSREFCTVQRQRTNTPLQALAGLNDPAAWEAAQALGQRMATAPGDDRARLRLGFRWCTSRDPDADELDLLAAALAAESAEQRWTLVANALLNLDETLSR
jgi:hypothetical protein